MRPGGYAPRLATHPLLVGRPLRLLYRRGSKPRTFVPDERSIFRGTTWMGLEASLTPSFGVMKCLFCVVNDEFQGLTPRVQTKIGYQYPNSRCGATALFLGTNGRMVISDPIAGSKHGFPGTNAPCPASSPRQGGVPLPDAVGHPPEAAGEVPRPMRRRRRAGPRARTRSRG
jgi:hypothetical protein